MSLPIRAGLLLSFLYVLPAHADLDHHCLAGCIGNGLGSAACLKQCSYNNTVNPVVIPEVTLESLEVHRSFPVPMPTAGSNDILAKQPKVLVSQEKDPVCVSACLNQGLQYDYCGEQCIKMTCAPNVILCPKPYNRFSTSK